MLNRNLPTVLRQSFRAGIYKAQVFSQKTWVRLVFVGVMLFVLSQKEFSFQFSFGKKDQANLSPDEWMGTGLLPAISEKETNSPPPKGVKISSHTNTAKAALWWEDIRDKKISINKDLNLANEATAVGAALTEEQKLEAAKFSNLGFILNPDLPKRKNIDPAVVAAKNQICYDYIARYAATAQEEAQLFNIPVSITLAQGLLESNAGASNLAKKDNNHFGLKCQEKCIGCRCANYTDDSKYDMFRIFESAWESFRAHSKLLTGKRYKHLLELPRTDYRNWAYGLKAAGYATDKSYAEKLIEIIEALQLNKFDN